MRQSVHETDDEVKQLDQLLEKKLSALREHVDDKLGTVHQDNLRTNERITKQSQSFREDMTRLNNRLDLVAAQVVTVGDGVNEIKETLGEQGDSIDKMQRQLERNLDQLDEHGVRIDVLEKKTAHLPTPLVK